jgi:uncharacterized protein
MLPLEAGQKVMSETATLSGLFIYPVKSARGIAQPCARLTPLGLEWDRQWMIVDERGVFLSQRTHPQLARLVPRLEAHALVLAAPELSELRVPLTQGGEALEVRVWDDRLSALAQGAHADEWLSFAVGQPVRLVRVAQSMGRRANPKFAGAVPAPIGFPDGYPFLVCNQASLDDLNARLPAPIPMERFRPNLVLEGLAPWDEDRIALLAFEGLSVKLVKPCTRCSIPSLDPHTGAPSIDPLPVLKRFRFNRELRGVTFGENAVIAQVRDGELRRGASAAITWRA